jgi:hypothetical protein
MGNGILKMAKRKRIPACVQRSVDAGFEDQAREAVPNKWFCSGYCPRGLPRVYGRGDTAAEAESNAMLGAVRRDHQYLDIHTDVGLKRWVFITFPPWKGDHGVEEAPAPVPSGAGA